MLSNKNTRDITSLMGLHDKFQKILPEIVASAAKPIAETTVIRELRQVETILKDAQQFLSGELPLMRQVLEHLRSAQMSNLSGALGATGLNTGSSLLSTPDDLKTIFEQVSKLQAKVTEQQAQINDLEARAEDTIVDIEGKKFPSLTFVSGYTTTHAISPHALKFVDAMSLMEMVTALAQNYTDSVDSQFRGGRVNLERPSNQKALYSFHLTAPTAFAGPPDAACSNPRMLGAFKSYSDFHGTGSGDSGTAYELQKLIDDKTPAFSAEIRTPTC